MHVVLLIENLESGGEGQRQLTILALALAKRGLTVEIVTYYPQGFFRGMIEEAGIPLTVVSSRTKVGRIWAMRREVKRRNPDVVVAFLGTPAMLAELAGIPRRKFGLVVSERTGRMHPPSLKERSYFHLHRLADVVVSNSHSLKDYISRHAPWLRSKLRVIHNCVNLDHFCPDSRELSQQTKTANVLLVVGRYAPEKNTLGLISAVEILARNHTLPPLELHWYGNSYFEGGRPTSSSQYYLAVLAELEKRHLVNRVFFHDETHSLAPIYQECSAFCLPSLYESFSNALSEAAACGVPLLASDVGDNRVLVRPKDNGFLFDPHSVESIAAALTAFLKLSQEDRLQMGVRSRNIAEQILAPERFTESYISLLKEVTSRS